jgi:multicomponent Na+:H+ antiporter subunit B
MQAVPPGVLKILSASGVLLYAGVGIETLLLGGNYLDYDFLAHEPTHGQHLGIFLVELGVGVTVASTMLLLYYAFAGREQGK